MNCEWTSSSIKNLFFSSIVHIWRYGCKLIVFCGDSASVGLFQILLIFICKHLFWSLLCIRGLDFFSNVSALSLRPEYDVAPVYYVIDSCLLSSKSIFSNIWVCRNLMCGNFMCGYFMCGNFMCGIIMSVGGNFIYVGGNIMGVGENFMCVGWNFMSVGWKLHLCCSLPNSDVSWRKLHECWWKSHAYLWKFHLCWQKCHVCWPNSNVCWWKYCSLWTHLAQNKATLMNW